MSPIAIRFNTRTLTRIFLITFCLGMLIHLMGVSNDLLNHDSVYMQSVRYSSLATQGKLTADWIIGRLRGLISTPSLFVPVGLALFALSACMISTMLGVGSVPVGVAIGLALISSERVVSMTVYYGTDYFAAVFTIATGSVFLTRCFRLGWIAAVPLLLFGVCGYQPYISVAACLFVLLCLVDGLSGNKTFRELLQEGCKYIGVLAGAGIGYYLLLKLYLKNGGALGAYHGIDTLAGGGGLGVHAFLQNIYLSWQAVCSLMNGTAAPAYKGLSWLYPTIGVMMIVAVVYTIIARKLYRKPLTCVTCLLLFVFALPIAINAVSVLSQSQSGHSIMKYSFALAVPSAIILLATSPLPSLGGGASKATAAVSKGLRILVCSIFGLYLFFSAMLCNDLYAYLAKCNHQLNAKATCLMSSMINSDQLDSAESVVILGADNPNRQNFFDDRLSFTGSMASLAGFTVGIDSPSAMITVPGILEHYLTQRLGFQLSFADRTVVYEKYKDVCDAMPSYPHDGSIQTVDGIMIVKLNAPAN